MMTCTTTSSAVLATLLATLALTLMLHVGDAEGKRGCEYYGHSCYGALGKRGSEVLPPNSQSQEAQDEDNPQIVFTGPRSEPKLNSRQLYNVSPLFRQWLQAYRKAQELRAEGI